ncbi:MAG: S8 family serine peptidase [Brevefilum sp.]|nr:S8 family serine peptidase [Brevefilum sp.]
MKKSRVGLILSVLLVMTVLLTAFKPVSAEPTNPVRVWVTYQKGGKVSVLSTLKRQDAEIHYDFPELDAYVVTVPEAALNGIWRNPFVIDIEPDPVRYPIEPVKVELDAFYSDVEDVNGQTIPWGIDAVQARDVWDVDRNAVVDSGAPTGEGITVCIIDTGYYADHEDLKDQVSGFSQVDDNYLNDGGAHGSHVAGTISALNNDLGVVGVSPGEVNLHIVKIFDNDGLWTSASNLVDAIYSCRDNGADVISMSLGGTFKSRTEEQAFNALYDAGILHVAAAGNDGNTRLSYPASYSSVISVAAINSDLNIADFSQQNSAVELAAPGVSVLSTVPFVDQTTLTVDGTDYNAIRVEYSQGNTSASGALVDGGLCASTGSWAGKVVLCQRGDISFYDKVMNVQNSGGAAAVIYNNEPGDLFATLGEGASSEILAVGITQTSGEELVTKIGSNATVTNIYTKPGSGYEAWDGTSMAAPHVSGVAALIWSANSSWTNAQIRNAMNVSALDLGAAGKDNAYGYGLVQAADALTYLGGGTVDNPPSVTITNPSDGATVSDTVAVIATASDDNGVIEVEFFVDGGSIGVDINGGDGWSLSWDTTAKADASYTVSATATDSIGQTATDSVTVTVDNGGGTTDPITLAATAYKVRGAGVVELDWTPITSSDIDIYRNGGLLTTVVNVGTYTDSDFPKGGGTATYKVCEAGTNICSNEVTVIW